LRLKVTVVCICVAVSLLTLSLAQTKLGFAADMPSPAWRTKTAMPTPRGQAAVVAGDNGLIYVMGGYDGSSVLSTVEAYNPMTDTWATKASMLQPTRGAAFAKGPDGIIYVISGTISTVQAYNTTSNTWSIKTSIPISTWMAGAATGNNGKIYVIGGESAGAYHYSNITQIYDPSTDSWTNGTDMPTGRNELGLVKGPDGLIYTMGGYNGTALSTVEAYNPSTNTWTKKAPMPSAKLEFGVVLGPDEKIYVIGGGTSYGNNNAPFFNTVEIYDPKTNTWTTPTWWESAMPTPRKELGAALSSNGRIYAIGGAYYGYIDTNQEASIVLPENVPPIAYIDSITPNPSTEGETVSFKGHGSDSDGSVVAYKWRSSIADTIIGTTASFDITTLSNGTHNIYFSVKDNDNMWSEEVMAIVTVNINYTEDPNYQQIAEANQAIDDLEQQLNNKVDDLTSQIADLNATIDNLNMKLDLMTIELLGAGVATLILVIVTIAIIYMTRSKKPPSTQTSQ